MDRAQKAAALDQLKVLFQESGVVVVAHYAGLTVAEMTELRTKLRGVDATLKVVKNRLAKIAIAETEGPEAAQALFVGPVAIVYAKDPVGAAKVSIDYAKENEKFVLQGGVLGQSVLDEKGVEALSKMPSLEEMRAKLLGTILEPGSKLARTLNEPGNKFARQLNAPASSLLSCLAQRKDKMDAA